MNDAATVTRAQNRRSVVPFASRLLPIAPIVACIALAGCSAQTAATRTAAVAPAAGPASTAGASPQIAAAGQPAPKGGGVDIADKSAAAGKSARKPGPVGVGLASYYGERFHGRRTANGEIFDAASLSAAHPSLPLPSYVRVTNVTNGRSVVVRVNDRGPFHKGRLIDVSKRTADVLGFRRAGVGAVKIDYVGRAPLAGSDDRQLLATYKEFGRSVAPDGVQLAGLKPVSEAELLGGAAPVAATTVVARAEPATPKVETNLVTAYAPPAAAPQPIPSAKASPAAQATALLPQVAKPQTQLAARSPAPESPAPDDRIAKATANGAPAAAKPASPTRVASKRVVKPTEEPVLATVAPQLSGSEAADESAPALRPAQSPAVAARIAASFEGFGDTPAFVRSQQPNLGSASAYSTVR